MAERLTSEVQLSRILEILPRAAREGGAPLAELAAALETDERGLLRDLEELYTRSYYHPAGSADDVSVLIESDQVEVWTTGEFRRPVRLNAQEALALGLGLRVLAADAPEPLRPGWLALAERLEERLSSETPEALLPHFGVTTATTRPADIHAVLADAARLRRRCRIAYLKPGAPEPEVRDVEPYVLLIADGRWYTVGRCLRSGEVRVFRLDRVVDACLQAETFTPPEGFDPQGYVADGRVYRADEDVEVAVRYSPRIARWIAEQGTVERCRDGSVVVRYRVADPHWVVQHVLFHGPDAEVLDPPEMRAAVVEAVTRVLDGGDAGELPAVAGP